MTFDESHSLLVRGIAAAKANSRGEARYFLDRALKAGLSLEDRVQAWRYLAHLSDDPVEKRSYLEQILAADPTDGTAQRDLAILSGDLDPKDIIDPERPTTPSESHGRAKGARFVCSQCGSSRVFFTPHGHVLECEHCHHTQQVDGSAHGAQAGERDFVATMWTARGHRTAQAMPSFGCNACGATFLVAAGQVSLTCPYCASVHTIERVSTRELLGPEAVIPFAFGEGDAAQRLETWTREQAIDVTIESARGVYLPVWVLNFVGEISWTGRGRDDETYGSEGNERISGTHTIMGQRVRVAGASHVPGPVTAILDEFDLAGLQPYDPRLLAAWPTAGYDISLEEAAVMGRSQAITALRPEVLEDIGARIRDVALDFSRMAVDSFTLALMPIWIAEMSHGGSRFTALINGQSGTVCAEIPRAGLSGWMERLLS
jgi:DNA-directed RNA polymerase subunit RPC12/RpoP